MKQKLSITLDSETVKNIERYIEEGRFRNKSHAVEYAIKRILQSKNDR